ncbi:hypothetical protein [Planococcus citreus]|uniref:Uncharacterized protein n=1 Tax=Planococcus citreus TaxID=1373 RepID=A0A497YGQ1_9BACL|nr:hypothetical protein [Planococcus citreus]RLJ90146.1 hypothetical protein DFR62_0288 [Planococcus citreus]
MRKNSVLLSELPNETELSVEESGYTITAGELRRDLERDGDLDQANDNWCTIQRKRWKPSAERMVVAYIEQEYDEMYEDWDDRAMECLKDEHYQRIQEVLDEAFKGDSATEYWSYEKDVIIDTAIKGQ